MDTYKQFEQVLSPVVESILHFLKIHRKVIFGNSPVVVEDMLGKAPESLDAVDVVLGSPIHQGLAVAHRMVLAQSLEGVVAPEGVRVVDRTLPSLLSDNGHQLLLAHMLHNPRIDHAIALQQAKYNVFALCSSSSLSLASAAKVGLVHLHLAIEFASLKLGHVVDGLAQSLIEAGNRLVITAKIMGKTVRRLLLVESLDDANLGAYLPQRLLFSTALVSASDVASRGLAYLKRAAEYALSTFQKVGRTTENVLSSLCHMGILTPHGYVSH